MGVGGEKQAEKPKPETDRKDTEMKLGVRREITEKPLVWATGREKQSVKNQTGN